MKTTKRQISLQELFRGVYMGPNPSVVHIVPSGDNWRVRREGGLRAIAVKSNKRSAVSIAKKLKNINRIVIHRRDGTFQEHIN